MKKPWIVLIAVLCLIVPLSYVAGAELAKEGEGTFRMAHTGTYKLLPMGNERSESLFEAAGLVVEAPESGGGPRCLDSLMGGLSSESLGY